MGSEENIDDQDGNDLSKVDYGQKLRDEGSITSMAINMEISRLYDELTNMNMGKLDNLQDKLNDILERHKLPIYVKDSQGKICKKLVRFEFDECTKNIIPVLDD